MFNQCNDANKRSESKVAVALTLAVGKHKFFFQKPFKSLICRFNQIYPKEVYQSRGSCNHDTKRSVCLWEAFKRYIKQLEVEKKNSSKTMELLFEMLKKIENGILPSKNEVVYLNNEATTPRTGGNWKQKLNMSKIKLFCKFYEVLFCEKSGRFKFFELLEPNEKNYLKDFANL